jgi:hypothetical protein
MTLLQSLQGLFSFGSASPGAEAPSLSRRQALTKFGLAGLFAVAAPTLLIPSEAEAQYRRRGRGRRYSRRELRRRCQDWRFRRRNRDLCYHAGRGGGRRGACVRFGPVEICD